MPATLSPEQIRDVNTRYHDLAADHYDAKWGINFGEIGCRQVVGKVQKALGRAPGTFGRSLEIGAGTGYFTLNLLRAGIVEQATCTDISPGMLLALQANADRLRISVETVTADAEELPFEAESFDLVLGHAVLHHIPNLERSFEELMRVLKPGGTILFAGEPSRCGDRIANVPKRIAQAGAPAWRALLRARPAPPAAAGSGDAALESVVDVHAFAPRELSQLARGAGFVDVRVRGEELLANWFGWTNRTLEASADPNDVPWAWRQYAYRGYLLLQSLDRLLLERRLPATIFYNLLLCARKPALTR